MKAFWVIGGCLNLITAIRVANGHTPDQFSVCVAFIGTAFFLFTLGFGDGQ